jgi:hypothetical protein
MSKGAQDWAMSDAASEILVLTQTDEEPGYCHEKAIPLCGRLEGRTCMF